MTEMNLAALTAEIDEVNKANGWRETVPSFAEAMMLVVTECAEAAEAWRVHGFTPWTVRTLRKEYCAACTGTDQLDGVPCKNHPDKPEGAGSELADIAIRVLDDIAVYGLKLPPRGFTWAPPLGKDTPFLEAMLDLTQAAAAAAYGTDQETRQLWLAYLWRHLNGYAAGYGFDLGAEVRRKLDYNKTRAYRHGGKRL